MFLREKCWNLIIQSGFDKSNPCKKERDCHVAALLAMTILLHYIRNDILKMRRLSRRCAPRKNNLRA